MGKESLLDFVSGWHVTPLHTFRHGFRRTWIVRAATNPVEKIIAHDFGVAVVKEAVAKPRVVATERFQAPVRSASTFMRETASNYPKSWAGLVSGNSNQSKDSIPNKSVSDGAIAASAVSAGPRTQLAASVRAPAEQHNPEVQPIAQSSAPVAQTETEYGEGAPVHISAASAKRRGPSLAVKLPSCCEAARRRDHDWADPRQLRQLTWRSARALCIIYVYLFISRPM